MIQFLKLYFIFVLIGLVNCNNNRQKDIVIENFEVGPLEYQYLLKTTHELKDFNTTDEITNNWKEFFKTLTLDSIK